VPPTRLFARSGPELVGVVRRHHDRRSRPRDQPKLPSASVPQRHRQRRHAMSEHRIGTASWHLSPDARHWKPLTMIVWGDRRRLLRAAAGPLAARHAPWACRGDRDRRRQARLRLRATRRSHPAPPPLLDGMTRSRCEDGPGLGDVNAPNLPIRARHLRADRPHRTSPDQDHHARRIGAPACTATPRR
jgi:hypothetical protein